MLAEAGIESRGVPFELDAHDSGIESRFREARRRRRVAPLDEPRQVVAEGALDARHAPTNETILFAVPQGG